MKNLQIILVKLILVILLGFLYRNGVKGRWYGNFEAYRNNYFAEANGKILFLDAEEGSRTLTRKGLFGVKTPFSFSLKRDQNLLASKNTIFFKIQKNVVYRRGKF